MKITIKHKILKGLREKRSIPLEVIPDKLGITIQEYQKYETEDVEVDLPFADRISSLFKRNWSIFLLDELPKDTFIKQDNRTIENQTPTLHDKTIDAIEDANYIFQFAQGLSTHNGLQIPKLDDIKDLSPEELGARFRVNSKITIEDQFNFKNYSEAFKKWKLFVENLGIFVSQYPLNIEDKIRAFSISDHDRAVIVLNSLDSQVGRIFSLLHELCHILRRNSGICDLHYSMSSDTEVFCNKFAASFLVPNDVIKNYVKSNGIDKIISDISGYAKNLSSRLKVSNLVIYRKFASFGIISDSKYSEFHIRSLNDFISIPIRHDDENPGGPNYYTIRKLRNGEAYSNVVLGAYNSGEINAFEAGNALGVKRNNLNEYKNRTA